MLDRLTGQFELHARALTLRAERQKLLAANIANVDTPNYKARDVDFASVLSQATGRPVPAGAGGAISGALPMAAPGASPATTSAGPMTASVGVMRVTDSRHLGPVADPDGGDSRFASRDMLYRTPQQPSIDGNTVDLDRERANFADNTVRYEATLRFIGGQVRTLTSAIRGE